jgi:hypothetical protein
MAERTLTGGCACGQLTFRARGEPKRVGLCHCMTCRKASGSVFGAWAMYPVDAVAIDGPYESWAEGDTTRCFCPTCAARVFSLNGDEVELGLGSFDEPNVLAPTYELWVPRREHWLKTDELIAYEKNREA